MLNPVDRFDSDVPPVLPLQSLTGVAEADNSLILEQEETTWKSAGLNVQIIEDRYGASSQKLELSKSVLTQFQPQAPLPPAVEPVRIAQNPKREEKAAPDREKDFKGALKNVVGWLFSNGKRSKNSP